MIRRLLTIIIALALPAGAVAQTTIELRSSAALKAGEPITLGDIAEVMGDDAEAVAGTVIEAAPASRAFDIEVKTVRAALDAGKVVKWGRTALRGSICSVTITGIDKAPTKTKSEPAGEKARPAVVTLDGPETVRTQVVRALGRLYAVPNPDLRVLFEERDAELLDTPAIGHRVDIQATNSPATSKVGLRTYVFAGDRLLVQRTISVDVLVRRSVLTALAPIGRGEEVTAEDFVAAEQWQAPSASVPCTREQAIGSIARARINAGQVITQVNVEAPVIVKKGEIVEIHCLSGAIHVKASRARAMAAGRDGELVQFQLEGSKRSFKARMSGRGSAVMVVEGETDAPTPTETKL